MTRIVNKFEYASFNGAVHFFTFQIKMLFLGNFGTKTENYLCKVKFGTQSNPNMQNAMMVFRFSISH